MSRYSSSQPVFSCQGDGNHGQVQDLPPKQTKVADAQMVLTHLLACSRVRQKMYSGQRKLVCIATVTDKLLY
jgi:hypothetical protein